MKLQWRNYNFLSPSIATSSPTVGCSLSSSSGALDVSIQWSSTFTSQHAIERYRVSVSPDPSSCSSDQVSPSGDYSCSGLLPETNYAISVNAINCGDQEGERETFTIVPQGIYFLFPWFLWSITCTSSGVININATTSPTACLHSETLKSRPCISSYPTLSIRLVGLHWLDSHNCAAPRITTEVSIRPTYDEHEELSEVSVRWNEEVRLVDKIN